MRCCGGHACPAAALRLDPLGCRTLPLPFALTGTLLASPACLPAWHRPLRCLFSSPLSFWLPQVLHIPDFDFRSSCLLLTECLAEVKAWSDAHPAHLPILLYMEVKGAGQLEEGLGAALLALLQGMLDRATAPGPTSFIQVPDTTAQTFRDLQGELLSAFGNSSSPHGQLLSPDDVRSALGASPGADLQQLLLRTPGQPCPWPSLSSMRGRVLPILILRGGSSQAAALEQAYPSLAGSVMWVEQGGRTPLPQAAFRASAVGRLGSGGDLLLDLPANASAVAAALAQSVRDAVATGFIVRARADADTVEARAGFTGRRDAIIAAGPQIVASDFLLPANQQRAQGSSAALYSTGYNVTLPGGQTARCLLNLTGTPAAESVRMQMVAAAAGDGIYCGPLEGAPPGKVAFQPESAAEGAVAGGPPPAPETSAAPLPPSSAGSAAAAAPPPPPGSGSITSGQPLVAIAAGIAALIAAVLAA
ncbi:hypothetical protein ABPG75_002624 [Micractinium tetrahymenae]